MCMATLMLLCSLGILDFSGHLAVGCLPCMGDSSAACFISLCKTLATSSTGLLAGAGYSVCNSSMATELVGNEAV